MLWCHKFPCLKQLMLVHEQTASPVIAIRQVPPENVSSYGVIQGRPLGNGMWEIADLVEKPRPQDAPSNLAVIGRYILPPEIFPVLDGLQPGVGGEIQLTDALKCMAKQKPLIGYEVEGIRYDVGDPKGFLVATVEIALSRPDLKDYFGKYLAKLVADRGLTVN